MSDLDGLESPFGVLFPNGNAIYFGPDGDQIPSIQQEGWEGVHRFLAEFEDATVYFGQWDMGEEPVRLADEAIDQIGGSA